jgi:serine/threonine protein kinase
MQILAEIMIHSSLKHPNVVRMEDTFEDDEHVYFRLELCKAGVSHACGRHTQPRLVETSD